MKPSHAFALIVLGSIGVARAAGIDCNKAASAADKAICANPAALYDDREMAVIYSRVAEHTRFHEKRGEKGLLRELARQQRAWLQERDSCATSRGCDMHGLYKARIAALEAGEKELGKCSEGSGADMAACTTAEWEFEEHQLNALVAEMRERLREPDPELAAQPAWLEYREKECASQASLNASWGGMQVASCKLLFTKRRIEELRSVHFCDDNGCPDKKSQP